VYISALKKLGNTLRQCWQVPLAGMAGGLFATFFHWPLPWMLGSLLAVIALRCLFPAPLAALPGGRQLGQCLVASGIGLHFTRQVFEQVLGYWPLLLLGALSTLLLALFSISLLRRAGVARATAFFASLPGGSSEMVILGLRHGAVPARVAAAHSLRLLLVVLLVPPLLLWSQGQAQVVPHTGESAGLAVLAVLLPGGAVLAWLWSALKQPNPWMLGPLCAAAAASVVADLQLSLPPALGGLGQWLIGCSLGCYFDRRFFRSAPRFLATVMLATLLTMLAAALLALLLARFFAMDDVSLLLGMMPGGIAEMTLTAEALQLSVALVTTLQVLRLFFLVFLATPMYRLYSRLEHSG